MSTARRVPEAALLVGLVLAFSVVLFFLLFGGPPLVTALIALALLYGFAAYAVVHDDDPASVLLPTPVLAAAALLALLLVVLGVVVGQPLFGLLVGFVAVVPPAMYHTHYGDPVNPLSVRATLALGGVGALACLLAGVALEDPLVGAVDAVVVALATADYQDTRGEKLDELVEFVAVSVCFGGAALAVLYFVLVAGRPEDGILVAGALLVVGAYFAMESATHD
ncbi:hypothetical protein [Natronomonas sp. EA1]|uniref:hypothetical protein n=1 Tax=Natronomonas sp. EA1 TaxID=3421655 RepID=UPI003EB89624